MFPNLTAMRGSEDVKLKSRKEESMIKQESKQSRGREHEHGKKRDRDKYKDKERNVEEEKRKDREKVKDMESRRTQSDKNVDYRNRETEIEHDRKTYRDKVRGKEKDRKKDRKDRVGDQEDKSEKERDKEKAKGKQCDKTQSERKREREKEKERKIERRERKSEPECKEEERDKRERQRRRCEAEIHDSGDERIDRDRKRPRRDHGYDERDQERSKSRDREKTRSHRHRDDSVDSQWRSDDVPERNQEKIDTKEQDMEEEQGKLDKEMEKRRRRVQEWQELGRKKEEEERQQLRQGTEIEPKAGKNWTLEGESDDDEAAPEEKSDTNMDVDGVCMLTAEAGDTMAFDLKNGNMFLKGGAVATEEEEIDPLDAFMNSIVLPEVEKLNSAVLVSDLTELNGKDTDHEQSNGGVPKKTSKKFLGRIMHEEDSDPDYEDEEDSGRKFKDEDDDEFLKRVKKTKAEKLEIVDHSKMDYIDFRKNFYMEVKEIARMTSEEADAYRKELELKVRGKDVPKPIITWHQTGLTTKVLEVIRKMNFEKPMPIQAQAFPVIMSGRDCIGIAKTGSGKTLAFVLPMLRHIKDQPPLLPGDGPIGLIMAPTRELVQQIHNMIKKFAKVMNLACVPVHGGSGVAQQIGDLKKGAEIVVCTPGRMIDILSSNNGKITNLRRVTFLVMDEADRMFDMGFEPQITRIVQNIRPDRQTVLFSATFPRQVEALAKKVLNKPVDIQAGGRDVVNSDITQMVEVRPERDRFLRLLELLGEWYGKGKILIFLNSQEKCDSLFRDLLKSGYPCLSFHGAKDQGDRESALADFKGNVCDLLIATSCASRGLDVKELELVINFDVPNYYEEYVHRVGRTGRAGRKGYAITFISEEEDKYAPDLLKALLLSKQPIPQDLKALADGFMEKVKLGIEQVHSTNSGRKGYKFDEEEDNMCKAAKKAQAKEYGFEYVESDSEDEDDEVHKRTDVIEPTSSLGRQSLPDVRGISVSVLGTMGSVPASILSINAADNQGREASFAAAMRNIAKLQHDALPEHYESELEINDFPQNARWKVTHKETLGPISEMTGAAIMTRGQYYPPGKIPGPNERKLFLFIEGLSEHSVKTAKAELRRVLEDVTTQAISLLGGAQSDRSKDGKPEALSCAACKWVLRLFTPPGVCVQSWYIVCSM